MEKRLARIHWKLFAVETPEIGNLMGITGRPAAPRYRAEALLQQQLGARSAEAAKTGDPEVRAAYSRGIEPAEIAAFLGENEL